jgi:hypothetical protein
MVNVVRKLSMCKTKVVLTYNGGFFLDLFGDGDSIEITQWYVTVIFLYFTYYM